MARPRALGDGRGESPCHALRVTVGTVVGLLASGRSRDEIFKAYPYLEAEDLDQALAYAAWRVEEREVPLPAVWASRF